MHEVKTNLVSVIMPAFNAAPTIAASIQSALAQDHKELEIVVADDGSTDHTAEIVQRIAQQDSRVRLVRTSGRQGPAGARNVAIDAASNGCWLAFLDSDDLWMPRKLSAQLRLARETGSPLIYSSYWRVSEDGNYSGHPVRIPKSICYTQLLGNSTIATSTVLLDRSVFGAIRLEGAVGYDDFELWTRLLSGGSIAHGVQEPLMAYRLRSGSVSRRRVQMSREVWRVLREYRHLSIGTAAIKFASYACRAAIKQRIGRPQFRSSELLPLEMRKLLAWGK